MRLFVLFVCLLLAFGSFSQSDRMAKREAKVRKQLAKDRPYKAISLCTGALGIEERPVFHVLRADARNRIGEFAEAERDAQQGLRAVPGDREAMLQLAIAQQGMGKYDSAVVLFRQIITLDSIAGEKIFTGTDSSSLDRVFSFDSPEGRYRLALAYQAKHEYASAIVQLRMYLNKAPYFCCGQPFTQQRVLAECLATKGDLVAADSMFSAALSGSPNDPVILNSRGWFLYETHGDHVKAIADYDRAIKQNPNYSYAFNNRGWSKFKNGDTAGALKDINLARKKKPLNPYIYRNLGIIALSHGDKVEACAQFQRALELNFTAVYGDEVELLARANCGGNNAVPKPVIPDNAPDGPKPAVPPTRTNAPE